MKKCLFLYLAIFQLFSSQKLHARDEVINAPPMRVDYNWQTTDEGQKTLAIRMTVAGFFLFAFAALMSGFIPHQTSETTDFSESFEKNTLLSD